MANLTSPIPPKPYGKGGRKVVLPVKATTQLYQGGMIAQSSGACIQATASGSTAGVIGVCENDALGGASDGSVRVALLTDQEFIMANDTSNPVSDSTAYGAILYAVDDHTVGTSSVSSSLPVAGRYAGFEDDGAVRVFIGWMGCASGTP